jgi:hypothetical protein
MVAARKDAIRDPHEVPDKSGPSESAKMRGVMSWILPLIVTLIIIAVVIRFARRIFADNK